MRKFKTQRYLLFFLFIQLIFIRIIGCFPQFIELYYAHGMYPYIAQFWRTLTGWIPFSVGDLFLFTLIGLFIRTLFRLIKKKITLQKTATLLLSWLSVLLFFFYFNWGLNYFRLPLSEKLNFTIEEYSNDQLETVATYLIKRTNALQLNLMGTDSIQVKIPYNYKEMYLLAPKGYEKLKDLYPFLSYKTPSIKSSLMSTFQSYIGVGGYLNPLTGEAHINTNGLLSNAPSTISHEMAHQIGYAAENEAEFIGFLASTQHSDIFFQYSGYKNAMLHSVYEFRKRDSIVFKKLFKQLNKGVKKDLQAYYTLRMQYKNPFEPYVKKGYHLFLKSNKQKDGIKSYNKMVLLLINYYAQKPEELMMKKKESK